MANRRLGWAATALVGLLGVTAPVGAQSNDPGQGVGIEARPSAPAGWAAPPGAVPTVESLAVTAGSPLAGSGLSALALASATAAAAGEGETPTVVARAEGLAPFALAGVSRAEGGELHAALRVHRPDGSWSAWLDVEGAVAADAGRAGSEPLWLGRADGYELAVAGPIPPDLQLHLVRLEAGAEPAAATAAGPEAGGALAPADIPAASQPPLGSGRQPPPTIGGRASWGARAVDGVDVAKEVRAAAVHHTADGAPYGYGPEQVPGMLRAIQAYHQDALGWWDIGYNFLVDRFGRIWEGRTGGVSKAVIGAHAGGFNTATMGVAVLGDFRGVGVDGTIFEALTQVISWKLFLSGADPTTNTLLVARVGGDRFAPGTVVGIPRIVGHGDLSLTSCPADIASQLPQLRAAVAARYATFAGGVELGGVATSPGPPGADAHSGDFNGDGRQDLLWDTVDEAGQIWFGQNDGSAVSLPVEIDPRLRPLVGDFDGEGTSDVLWHGEPGAMVWYGQLSGTPRPVFVSSASFGEGAAFDGDGDGDDDVAWHDPDGGQISVWLSLGPGGFRAVLAAERPGARPVVFDPDGDGRDDVLWYRAGQPVHDLWRSTGDLAAVNTGPVFRPGDREPAVGDFDGDDRDDLVLTGASGTMLSWLNLTVDGELPAAGALTAVAGDLNGGGPDELLLVDRSAGSMIRYQGRADRLIAGETLPAPAGLRPLMGDVNGDARADVRWIGSDGSNELWLAR